MMLPKILIHVSLIVALGLGLGTRVCCERRLAASEKATAYFRSG